MHSIITETQSYSVDELKHWFKVFTHYAAKTTATSPEVEKLVCDAVFFFTALNKHSVVEGVWACCRTAPSCGT